VSKKYKKQKKLTGIVHKIVKPAGPGMPEKAEISVHEADELYREIRIENALVTEDGERVKLKEGADVDVIVETDASDLIKKTES